MSAKTEVLCFAFILLFIMLITSGCSSNEYAVDCYVDKKLVYRNVQKTLVHFNDVTKYDECNTYTIK